MFKSQAEEMNGLDQYMRAASKKNLSGACLALYQGWRTWFDGLKWFTKNVNPMTLSQARKKIGAFNLCLGSPFGDEVQFSLTSTGMTRQYGSTNILAQGSSGAQVAAWQKIIGVSADGQFGPATAKATKKWQSDHGLTPDGIVGPETWAAASGAVPSTVLSSIQTEIQKDQPFGLTYNDAPFAGAVGVTPTGVDLGDVDDPRFLQTAPPVGVPVQEASMFGAIGNLPTWAKVGLGVITAGGIVLSTPVKYGGLRK